MVIGGLDDPDAQQVSGNLQAEAEKLQAESDAYVTRLGGNAEQLQEARVRDFEQHVATVEYQLRVRDEARARRAAEGFEPPEYLPTLTERLARLRVPRVARIAGLVNVGNNVVIQAKHKTGKTTLTANLVRSLADGEPFLGCLSVTPPRGRTGLINYEMDPDQMDDWLRDTGIQDTDRVSVLDLRGYRMPLIARPVQEFLTDWACSLGIEVLILDPWGRAMAGSGSENSNDDVRAVLEILGEIKRQAGISDLFVLAHMGHQEFEIGQERARGASELLGWPDALWVLTKNDQGLRFLSAVGRDVEFPESQLGFDPSTRRLTVAAGGIDRRTAAANSAADKVADVVSGGSRKIREVRDELAALGITNHDEQTAAMAAARKLRLVHETPHPADKRSKLLHHGPDPAAALTCRFEVPS